ncbi:hypothetical protein PPERSA_07528 [Pseudocohnilembus persalinus]|uniref:Transmembrane protein n=1 Tax=Pseudocohnilembus persalinus TaxID=266149 RepID=A0A0V0QZR6_PSEPJ|nr:hypothetical protein PPERSA_07528 [Pseudocohnilembus persalinus]|eukprot:KRX07778.1 hypothetical protein PPERSA_07528 [Pseudocohnilembus persalinus]
MLVLELNYNPGDIEVSLDFEIKNQNSEENPQKTFDIYRYNNAQSKEYICFIKAMQTNQWNACKELYNTCQSCENQECQEQLNQTELKNQSMVCCTGCKKANLQIIGQQTNGLDSQPLPIQDVQDDSEIYIIDNSPFPNGLDSVNNKLNNNYNNIKNDKIDKQGIKDVNIQEDILFDLKYQINIQSNNDYYTWTLVLAIIMTIVLIVLVSILCIFIYMYKKAKTKYQEYHLINGDDGSKAYQNKNSNNKSKSLKAL